MKFNSHWQKLYLIGGIAPIVVMVFYISQFFVPVFGYGYPSTMEGWFALFQINKLLGLFTLNALDMLSIALLAPMFLALLIQLKEEDSSLTALGSVFSLIGISVFLAARSSSLAILNLSNQYASTTDPILQQQLLTTANTIDAVTSPTIQSAGFFYIAIAMLLFSLVMLKSQQYQNITGIIGIIAAVMVFFGDLSLAFIPSISGIMLGIAGLPVLTWWLMVSINLLKSGKEISS
jgi:hypothetical protein